MYAILAWDKTVCNFGLSEYNKVKTGWTVIFLLKLPKINIIHLHDVHVIYFKICDLNLSIIPVWPTILILLNSPESLHLKTKQYSR